MVADLHRGFTLLATLHRDPAAAAAFTGPVDGTWRRFFGLLPTELLHPPLSASQWAAMTTDVYVTVNGIRPAKGRSRTRPFTDCRAGDRGDDVVAALNAVWMDLDTYTKELSPEQVLAALETLKDDGRLPSWSLEIRSGRGLWVVWLLTRDDSESPPQATAANKAACVSINRALALRFAHLGADPASTNLARVTRVPGTINSTAVSEGKAGVVTWKYSSPLPRYTIGELSAAFPAEPSGPMEKRAAAQRGHAQTRKPWVDRGTYRAKRAPRGRPFCRRTAENAVRRRWGYSAMDILALWVVRDGYKRGQRHRAIFWIAVLLKLAWPSELGKSDEIHRICDEVNKRCKPPLSAGEVDGQIAKALAWESKGHVTNRKLAGLFGVTAEEAPLLQKLKPTVPSRRETRRAAAATIVDDWLEAKGTLPTDDELAGELTLAGYAVSRTTVWRDRRATGSTAAPPANRNSQRLETSAKNETAGLRSRGGRSRR